MPQRKTTRRIKAWRLAPIKARLGEPFDVKLAQLVTDLGLTRAAHKLGVGASTLNRWLEQYDISTAYVALAPGDRLFIRRRRTRSPPDPPTVPMPSGGQQMVYQ